MEDRFYTTIEVAQMLKVTTRTLQRWRRDGDGPVFVKIGGLVRYSAAALEDYLDAVRAVR